MELMQLMQERYSCRKFEERPVGRDVIERILEAGRVAPTAHNEQPQRILVIDEKETLAALDRCTKCRFGAPAALLVCYDKTACWHRARYDNAPSGEVDVGIVTTHMMLMAASLGVGTTWVMHFDPAAVRTEFSLPENFVPTAILVMGYPAADAAPAPAHSEKKSMEELVFDNKF